MLVLRFLLFCGFAGLHFAIAVGWELRCVRICGLVVIAFYAVGCRWRPYRVECTGSLPTSEVKRRRARLVLGGGRLGSPQGAASFCVRHHCVPLGSWCWCCVSFCLWVCGFAGLRFANQVGWELRCARIYGLVVVAFSVVCCRLRPYRVEGTGSLPTSEVKRRRARLVLGGRGPLEKTSGCCQLLCSVAPRLPCPLSRRLRVILVV